VPARDSLRSDAAATPAQATSPNAFAPTLLPAARTYRPSRLWWGVGTMALANAGAMVALDRLWYSQHVRTRWHWYDQPGGRAWYDDWYTYAQQDKLGHVLASFHLTRATGAYGRWAGLSRQDAALFGGAASFLFQAQIEFLDGFSANYGASRTDLLANALGSTWGALQVAYPSFDGVTLKYSYTPSPYYDPANLPLGNAIQDYSGITYWLVVRPDRLLPGPVADRWPSGLGLALGHSGRDLKNAVSGVDGLVHQRQLYLAPDIDLLALADWPKPVRGVLEALSFIHLPMPTLQITPTVRWHWLFF
jgi:uncharacterized protein YfiM (DUF2279 family)